MADSRRSRSPEPSRERRQRDDRDRRDRPRNSHRSGGFKWKERRDTTDEREGGEKRLERGYRRRSRSPRRDRDRDRDREREKTGSSDKYGVADKFGTSSKDKDKDKAKEDTSAPPERAPAAAAQPVGEPMIIVHVNDRLGTKAGIPCLASDTIGDFKKIVAMQIGRKPHEIMLKRQGQRPFKDQITLADYEISNGVQLDLEVDTGE